LKGNSEIAAIARVPRSDEEDEELDGENTMEDTDLGTNIEDSGVE
jgi:hypothetical protein